MFSGNLGPLADTYHSGSGIFVSVLVILGVTIPKRDTTRLLGEPVSKISSLW